MSATRASVRVRTWLVVAELALTLVLLCSAGLLLRSLWLLTENPPGFSPRTTLMTTVEYDGGGRVVWSASLRRGDLPSAALRLPGGNTLVYCSGTLVELDRTGKEVSRRPAGSRLPLALR